mgnify:CR=1 FL=1
MGDTGAAAGTPLGTLGNRPAAVAVAPRGVVNAAERAAGERAGVAGGARTVLGVAANAA